MKRIMAILFACMMVVSVIGCASAPSTTTEAAAAPQAKAASDLKVVVVTTDALGGGGVPDDMNKHLKRAIDDFGVNGSIYEATDASQYEEVLRTYAREKVDLIITTFPEMVEAVTTVSKEFPDVKFSIMLPLSVIDSPNVRCCEFACWELYYLAGIAAGKMTDTKTVGHVLGAEQSALIANDNAYIEGLKTTCPDAKVEVVNANSFNDPAVGKDVGLTLISKGCDVILTDCSNTASGVIEACKENGVYVFGDSGVHYPECPEFVLGDTNCNYGPATYQNIKDLVEGTWEGGVTYLNLKSGSISLDISPEIAGNIPDDKKDRWNDALKAIEEAQQKIISGELTIEMNTNKAF